MAYFHPDIISAGGAPAATSVVFPKLGPIERETVIVSLSDEIRTARKGKLARLSEWIFAVRPSSGLASPRLEMLRRYAILFRVHGDALGEHDRAAFIAAGFTEAQRAEVHLMVRRFAPPRPSLGRRLAGWGFGLAGAGLLTAGLYWWLTEHLGDGLISTVVLLLLAGALLPLTPRD